MAGKQQGMYPPGQGDYPPDEGLPMDVISQQPMLGAQLPVTDGK